MKAKRKAKEGMQVGLFEQEMLKPVDLREIPPAQADYTKEQEKFSEGHQGYRPYILIGSTKSCPVCGKGIKAAPDGTVRCTACWWWQGLNEK